MVLVDLQDHDLLVMQASCPCWTGPDIRLKGSINSFELLLALLYEEDPWKVGMVERSTWTSSTRVCETLERHNHTPSSNITSPFFWGQSPCCFPYSFQCGQAKSTVRRGMVVIVSNEITNIGTSPISFGKECPYGTEEWPRSFVIVKTCSATVDTFLITISAFSQSTMVFSLLSWSKRVVLVQLTSWKRYISVRLIGWMFWGKDGW